MLQQQHYVKITSPVSHAAFHINRLDDVIVGKNQNDNKTIEEAASSESVSASRLVMFQLPQKKAFLGSCLLSQALDHLSDLLPFFKLIMFTDLKLKNVEP